MFSKEQIYQQLSDIMVELFETDQQDITMEARLYEDLDIDSIDAVDMAVKLRELTGKKIQPSDFKQVRTVEDVVDAVFNLQLSEAAS